MPAPLSRLVRSDDNDWAIWQVARWIRPEIVAAARVHLAALDAAGADADWLWVQGRILVLLSHHYRPEHSPVEWAAIFADWRRAVSDPDPAHPGGQRLLPGWAVAEAFDRAVRECRHRPPPAVIRGFADDAMARDRRERVRLEAITRFKHRVEESHRPPTDEEMAAVDELVRKAIGISTAGRDHVLAERRNRARLWDQANAGGTGPRRRG